MKRRLPLVAAGLALMLLASACAEEEVLVNPPAAAGLPGTRWVVTGFTLDGIGGVLPAGAHLSLDFDASGGAGGTAGCNTYFAAVALTDDGITITGIGSTEMACEPAAMDREERFLSALSRAASVTREGDGLTLAAADGSASIDLIPFVPEADRPLAGTEWQLATFVVGGAASSVLAGTTPTLTVDDLAGRVSGSAGCNSFGGSASFGEQTVEVGPLVSTKMACDKSIMDQEAQFLLVLGAAVDWEIEGTTLRLTTADGRALELRAG
jgi:heat shock protein HslJ